VTGQLISKHGVVILKRCRPGRSLAL